MKKELVELLKEQKSKGAERRRMYASILSQINGEKSKDPIIDYITKNYHKTPNYVLNITVFESGMPFNQIVADVTDGIKKGMNLVDLTWNAMTPNSSYTPEEAKLAETVQKWKEEYSKEDGGWYFVRAKLTDSDEPFIEYSGYFKRPSENSVTVSKGNYPKKVRVWEAKSLFNDAKIADNDGKEIPYKKLDVIVGIGTR